MKLKDILEVVMTCNSIKIGKDCGEEFYPTYAEIDRYKEYYVCDLIASDKRELLINIKSNQ